MKPSRGLVPWAPAAFEYWAGLATNGPLARDVRDAALMLDVMAGPVVGEPYGGPRFESSLLDACDREPDKLRIAFTTDQPHGTMDAEVRDTFLEAVAAFEGMGHELTEASPDLGGLFEPFKTIVAGNSAAAVMALGEIALPQFESSTLAAIMLGHERTAAQYCDAVNTARNSSARIMQFWSEYDFLLTPTLTKLPPASGAMPSKVDMDTRWQEYLDWLAYTYPFNITGQPAVSVPAGWSSAGNLPIGLQIIGRMGADDHVLGLAAAYEAARPWADRRPSLD